MNTFAAHAILHQIDLATFCAMPQEKRDLMFGYLLGEHQLVRGEFFYNLGLINKTRLGRMMNLPWLEQ